MIFEIVTSPRARRDLKSIPPDFMRGIHLKIKSLAVNPGPHGCEKLKGDDLFRVRVNDYRIVYKIFDKRVLVIVVHVGHRREVYRDL